MNHAENIKIKVETKFLPEESKLHNENIWTYFINITNTGSSSAKLLSRHWLITENSGESSEVVGDGVVGVQPVIAANQSFEYNSFVTSKSDGVMMSGNYVFEDENGEKWTTIIPPFYT
jgi:ApaG protein